MSFLKNLERGISNLIPHQHSAERRATMNAANEQIQFYKSEKDRLINVASTNKAEKENKRRRINEKEIRSRKRAFKPQGFMNISPISQNVGDSLGG